YTVQASSPGLAQAQAAAVRIAGGVATLNVSLRVAAQKQVVTVQAEAAPEVTVDPSQSASSLVISNKNLDALSDDPDDLQADLLALAGPGAGPNGGQIFIDGLTNGDSALPDKSAIREVRVNQSPFSPEYDAIGFGRIEILTKPGANQWHGQADFNYGNGALNSRNPYAERNAPFDLKEFGGSASGSISRKASMFFDIDR
ncbi:MAG: TonB-dependent receptor, partial [Bryobacteraceae bacterium]